MENTLELKKKKKKKSILRCIKGYYKETILAPITVMFEVVMEILIPLVMSDILNMVQYETGDVMPEFYILKFLENFVGNKTIGTVYGGLILICFGLISLLFGALSGTFASRASAGFAKNLRREIYYVVQDFSFENIDKFSSSSLVTRSTTDVATVQMSFMMIIRTAVRSPFMLIFACVMAFRINADVARIFLYVIPVLFIGLVLIMRFSHPYFKKMFKCYDRMNTVVQENVAGSRTVKAFVREDHENEKFFESSADVYKYSTKAERILAFNNPLMQLCINACVLGISYLGAQKIVLGTLNIGQFNSLLTYVMQILMSLMMLSFILLQITMSIAAVNRISAVINEEPTIKNCENPIYDVKDGSIEFNDVSFAYDGKDDYVLKDINLKIESGETIGIIGSTGSAKSTFVNLIPRLYDITKGSLKIGDIEVKDYDIESLRDAVSVVLQKNVLFSGTIYDNLRWGNEKATNEELEHAAKLAQADEFVSQFPEKYETHIEQGGTNVSGGQRQRLCIARALVKKPKILILDDSTSAVDTKTDALIRKAFREEIPETTKIIIAQRISSVEDCDKIIVLDDGKIESIGNHEELLKVSKIYSEVYESQVRGAGKESD